MAKAPRGRRDTSRDLLLALALVALLVVAPAGPALARDAYVTNEGSESVSVIDTQTRQARASITVGDAPEAIAITPDGKAAYVTNYEAESVSVIDTQANQAVGAPIPVGSHPDGIAISPDGKTAYVTSYSDNSMTPIDTQTNQVTGSPVPAGLGPYGVAISPDGRTAYVADYPTKSVSVIDTQTHQVVGSPITVALSPTEIAITPDGGFVYVVNQNAESISVIDAQTRQVVDVPIPGGTFLHGIAISPDGKTAFVTNPGSGNVPLIDTQTNQVVGAPIPVAAAYAIAITPDGRLALVSGPSNVSVIDTQTRQVVGSPIPVGSSPFGIAITPDQPPRASFTSTRARPGVPVSFNASASSDPDGTIASFDWAFGDGQSAPAGGSTPSHTYQRPGTYRATLTLTDDEGCSTALIFTGQTAYCDGQASASQAQALKVAYPGVRVRCPKRAKPRGCRFKLQAVSKKRKGRVESAVAKARTKAGKSLVVSLKPKKKFRSKLAAATKILVRETATLGGSARIVFRKLKVVQ